MIKKSPQLRFEGFTDDWEERKWIDTVDMSTNMVNPKTGDYDDLLHIGPGNIESFTGRILDNVNTVKNDNLISGKFHFNPNDIIYGKINPQLAKYVHVDFEGLASADAYVLNSKNGVNQGFLFVELQTSGFYKYSVSVSMRTGMPKINRDELNQFSYLAPKNIEEQQRIGSFFKQLDETIALHQRKLDLLKEQKKGYLQKMFPKNVAKVPELRFAGFADDWEERKFKDNIVSIQTGTNLLGSTVNEGTPLIKMGNLQRGYFSFKKLEYLDSNSNVGSEDIVNYGDFLFNTRNTLELVGKGATWTGIGGKYAFNSNIARFKFDGIDTIFFNYLYNTQQVISQVHARAVGTTSVSAVYPRDLNSLLYYLPSIEEQQKIGSFFKQLDDTIALHQRKLDLLKEQKKGFLQKMFV